jgi:transcriptional regulator with XRE-family HTH domain
MRIKIKLREIREIKGISQEDLAFRLGLSQSQYSKIERGVFMPSLIVLVKAGAILGVKWYNLVQCPPPHRTR